MSKKSVLSAQISVKIPDLKVKTNKENLQELKLNSVVTTPMFLTKNLTIFPDFISIYNTMPVSFFNTVTIYLAFSTLMLSNSFFYIHYMQ